MKKVRFIKKVTNRENDLIDPVISLGICNLLLILIDFFIINKIHIKIGIGIMSILMITIGIVEWTRYRKVSWEQIK